MANLPFDCQHLIDEALTARDNAYVPYSGFSVGAALLTSSGKIYRGCNIENAAFSPGICAERTAFAKAVSEGERRFTAIAVVGGAVDKKAGELGLAFPCGVCRQVMREFCNDAFLIITARSTADFTVFTLAQLLPSGFGPADLGL